MEDTRIQLGDIGLQVRDYPNDGEAIVFLHFGGGNLLMWQGVVPFFSPDYRLILVDLKGHGLSDKPAEGYHIDQLADEVAAAMEALKVDRAHIIGSSMGAEVGLSLAAHHPQRVRSLVCDGALFSEAGPYGLWQGSDEEYQAHAADQLNSIRRAPLKTFPSEDAFVETSKKIFAEEGWWNDTFEAVKRRDATLTADGEYVGSWSLISADYTSHYLFYRFEDYYRRVTCPLLMLPDEIPGQDERERAIMEGLCALTAKGRVVNVPGWVHPFGWILDPEPVSKAVLAFLAGVKD